MSYPIQLSMIDYSQYFLPVQALNSYVIERAFSIERLFEDVENDSVCNDLSKTIIFQEEDKLENIAEIKAVEDKYQITFYLPYAQFLWSVSLYLITYFDNCVQIPAMNERGCNSHGYKQNIFAMKFADDTFRRARMLQYGVTMSAFTEIPNIYDPQIFKEEISKANSAYIASMTFVFAHEFSHNFLGHTHIQNTYQRSIDDEMAADDSALDYLSDEFDDDEWGDTYKIGVVLSLCSLLLLGEDSITGKGVHPHMDIRIERIMTKLDLPESDIIWGLAGSAIRLWLLVYGDLEISEDMSMEPVPYYKDFYNRYIKLLTVFRQRKYPDLVKPAWDID